MVLLSRRVPNARLWAQEPIQKTDDDYYLAVIEFDDQGWFQDPKQREALEHFLKQKTEQNEDLLIVAFIHGWKHNAEPDDSSHNLFAACFVTHALAKETGAGAIDRS